MTNKNNAQPIILIDYDDTLLPTTFLEESGFSIYSPPRADSSISNDLKTLDDEIVNFFTICRKYGKPVILTNAEKQWVLKSSEVYLPKTNKILASLEIHSAREKYSKKYKNAKEWKKMLLLNELKEVLLDSNFIIGIGDSEYERMAIVHFCENNSDDIIGYKNFLLNVDVTNITSSLYFIQVLNAILPVVINFKSGSDYTLGMKTTSLADRKKAQSPRKSQKGLVRTPYKKARSIN